MRHALAVFGEAELKARVAGVTGLLCVLSDSVNADVLAAAPNLRVVSHAECPAV